MAKIKAVLFDLGGVFFEDGTEKFLNILSKKTNKKYQELYPIFRQGKSLEYRENKLSGKVFFDLASNEIGQILKPDELNNLWASQYTEINGVRNIAEELKKQGLTVGILSDNVPERVNYLQKKYKFLGLFDLVIFSYEANLTKGNPEIYNLALNKLKLQPNEVIFVDDRQSNLDIAKEVGIVPILFTDSESLKEKLKQYLV